MKQIIVKLSIVYRTIWKFIDSFSSYGLVAKLSLINLWFYYSFNENIMRPYPLKQNYWRLWITYWVIQQTNFSMSIFLIISPLTVVKYSFDLIFLNSLSLSLIICPFSFIYSSIFIKILSLPLFQALKQLSLISLSIVVHIKPVSMIPILLPVT